MFFDERIIELGMDAKSDTDVITQLAKILTQKNIVKKSFTNHVSHSNAARSIGRWRRKLCIIRYKESALMTLINKASC